MVSRAGKSTFANPAYEASFKMVREITDEFPSGWSGLTRDEALFNFAQQKAVFLATGTYEAEGIREQAAGKFDLGLMDFPLPSPIRSRLWRRSFKAPATKIRKAPCPWR